MVDLVAALSARGPPIPSITEPLQLILWENIGYLIDDGRRLELLAAFEAAVGFNAAAILSAADETLMAIAVRGGMRPETRVQRWREIAQLVGHECDGDLGGVLRAMPLAKARALLKRFPSIGDPGVDKVLLFSGVAARPCLESNGLRALARLGVFEEKSSYAASYRAAIAVLSADGRPDREWLMEAYVRLREHGKTLCRRGEPNCLPCVLDRACAHRSVMAL